MKRAAGTAGTDVVERRDLTFGIEIETVGVSREAAAHGLARILGGTVEVDEVEGTPQEKRIVRLKGAECGDWRFDPDASLTNVSPELQVEIVSPPLREQQMPILMEVVRKARSLGLRVDETCGLHVHVDARPFDAESLRALVAMTPGLEAALRHLLALPRERLERYARLMGPGFFGDVLNEDPATMEGLKKAYYGPRYRPGMAFERRDPDRYRGLNLNSVWLRRTVEFRHFPGTLDERLVRSFVLICLDVASFALEASSGRR